MKRQIEHKQQEISVLGFHQAGWTRYCKSLRSSGTIVYTTTDAILDPKDSIYVNDHDQNTLINKSKNKSKDPKSVAAALRHLGEILLSIKSPLTRSAIIQYISSIERLDESEIEQLITDVEETSEPTEAMMQCVINLSHYADPKLDNSNPIDLAGYAFARALYKCNHLENLLHEDDNLLSKQIKEWSSYVNIETKPLDIQETLAQSKRLIVDTLQTNLNRLQQGSALIEIHVVVSSALSSEKFFSPDWNLTMNKIGFLLTNAEIRMIYKLSREMNDPLIKKTMMESVKFIQSQPNNFEEISPPWENNDDKWQARVRSNQKKPYTERMDHEIPNWVQALTRLSQTVAAHLEVEQPKDLPSRTSHHSTSTMLSLLNNSAPTSTQLNVVTNLNHDNTIQPKEHSNQNSNDNSNGSSNEQDEHDNSSGICITL